ncbi:hypothetical protein GDO81_005131 [Engystomops pustulosus]|uniref:Uncharacterized protein n=1 Tax=Engystomops pustulosus TaxID=76066 RepID=A0AAV7CLS7_ENGPU|nr:hypothetical protein GDO81_005131 [Engystomops pustulosus]
MMSACCCLVHNSCVRCRIFSQWNCCNGRCASGCPGCCCSSLHLQTPEELHTSENRTLLC